MALLPHDQVLRIHRAIVATRLTEGRAALLGGIDAALVAGLPTASDPSSQILSDLNRLNAVQQLTDGSVPLRIWLETALHLVGLRVEGEVFRRALDLVGDGGPSYGSVRGRLVESEPPATALHQLRAPPADFTGREKKLADLLEKMGPGGSSISGIQGQGGVGKTALALKLAYALAPHYPDAQIDLDLKGSSSVPLSHAAVMAHVIRAFRPAAELPQGDAELGALYRSVLHGKRALLLFDNARDRTQVEPLLPPPGCIVIVTSRHRFALSGLYACILDQLEPKDAIALLQKIASRIDAGSARAIADLCGYLPLTLRLAASALAERIDLEPGEYAEDLRSTQMRLELVDASLSLSLDLLPVSLQMLWFQFGVFPGDFDREAAVAVGGLELGVTRSMLSELVKHSMVEHNAATKRYKLHDLGRLYAGARLGEVDRYVAERRHAEHFKEVAARAEQLYRNGGKPIVDGLELFDREWENIKTGQAWAAAHSTEDDIAAGVCSDYPIVDAHCLALRQHPRERIHWHEVALAATRRLGRRKEEGMHLSHLGQAYAHLGEPRRSIELFEQALPIFRELGDRRSESDVLVDLGMAYVTLDEPRRAIALQWQGLEIAREIGDREIESNALGNLGLAYMGLDELHLALVLYEQCLGVIRDIGYRQGEGTALGNMATIYAALGDVRRAIALLEQCLVIARELGHRLSESASLCNMANAYLSLGDMGRAIALYEECLMISREIGQREGESIASWNLGVCYEKIGELKKAIPAMELRVDYARSIGHLQVENLAARVDALRARLKTKTRG